MKGVEMGWVESRHIFLREHLWCVKIMMVRQALEAAIWVELFGDKHARYVGTSGATAVLTSDK